MDVVFSIFFALAVPAAVLVLSAWFRSQERLRLLDVVRKLAEEDRPLSTEVLQVLPGGQGSVSPQRDLRRGVMLLAIGAGFALLGLLAFVGNLNGTKDFGVSVAIGTTVAAVGAIPICVGAALIFLSRTDR